MLYALEGLRGVAALMVALFHGWSSTSTPWFRHGWIAVDLFFVISGYVMSHVYREHMDSWEGVRRFGLKRFGRLYPLHLFTLAAFIASEYSLQALKVLATVATNPANFDLLRPWSLVSNLLLLNGVGLPGERTYNAVSWSISAEVWTYVVFAITCVLLAGKSKALTWIAFAALSLLTLVVAPRETAGGLFRCMWAFFLGATLPLVRARLTPSALAVSVAQLLALAVTLVMVALLDAPGMRYAMALPFAALVLTVSFDYGALAWVLRKPWLQLLGRLSYSIYMTHWIVLVFFNPVGPRLPEPYTSLLKIPYLLAVLVVSILTYRFIEQPWRNRFRLIADRRLLCHASRIQAVKTI